MDILAAIAAYLGCAAGIAGALIVSLVMVLAPAGPATSARQISTQASAHKAAATQTVALASRPKTETAVSKPEAMTVMTTAMATPPKSVEKPVWPAKPNFPAATAEGVSRTNLAIAIGRRGGDSRAHLRRFVQKEQARRLAYRQDPDFESRFLGYAD
jgi:hypothetical protein